jgi:adenine deaminase
MYIMVREGSSEKNLATLFDEAERAGAIFLIGEAGAGVST